MASEEVSASDIPLLPRKDMERAERRERRAYVALCVVLLFNVLGFLFRQREAPPPHWPMKAVRDTELAATEWCSGHGHVFVDTEVSADGKPVCECFECFTGLDCSIPTVDCVADVDVGDPLLFEEYWKLNPDLGAVVIPGWYRMSYFTNDAQRIFFTDALTASIRELHALTGNAVTEGRYIAVGNGAMQLINAIVHGLALQDTDAISPVVSTAPYYNMYPTQTNFLDSQHYEWAGEPDYVYESSTRKGIQIQLIATPNNPTAAIQDVADDFKGHVVYDYAYYWPHLTPITEAKDSDIMVFTFSKITGHAGSRLGWALLKDFDLYQKVSSHVFLTTGGVSHDTQLRATQIMRDVVKSYAGTGPFKRQGIFHFAHEVLQSRWTRMQDIFENTTRFTLQELKPEYCTFFEKISAPSPAYAWIHCNREEDVDCFEVMKTAGIIGRPGSEFGSSSRYVRFALVKRQADFENLAIHLLNLVTRS